MHVQHIRYISLTELPEELISFRTKIIWGIRKIHLLSMLYSDWLNYYLAICYKTSGAWIAFCLATSFPGFLFSASLSRWDYCCWTGERGNMDLDNGVRSTCSRTSHWILNIHYFVVAVAFTLVIIEQLRQEGTLADLKTERTPKKLTVYGKVIQRFTNTTSWRVPRA